MADVYTPPPDSSYLLVTPFSMPSDTRDRWAVSFTGKSSALVAAALSVVVTVSFACLWNFISFVAVLSVRKHTRHRFVAVVTLWNSHDPWFAFKELLHYTYRQAAHSMNHQEWSDFWYAFGFCFLALAVYGSSIAMGIVAPSLVQIGNVAPVRPSTVFYPATPADSAQELRDFGLRAPSVMRALGSVEAAAVTLRLKVTVKQGRDYQPLPTGDRNISLDYGYSLSGVDLGISGGSDLGLAVEGHCITEYSWSRDPPNKDDPDSADYYRLWNDPGPDPALDAWVLLNEFDTAHAPSASFILHPNGPEQLAAGSDMLYAVMVHSARRSSITDGGDPWYATEPRQPPADASQYNAAFWMKRRRPVLSCREKNSWTYAGQAVSSVLDLKSIAGIKIPQVLLEILETTLGGGPMVVRLGNASGDSALRSRTTSPNGVIDAGASSMFADMERLILASYAATRNIFTDAVMFGQPGGYENLVKGPDGQPREGAGKFVVSSPDIQTFSLTGIVTLAVILLVLILLNCLTWLLVHFNHQHGQHPVAAADAAAEPAETAETAETAKTAETTKTAETDVPQVTTDDSNSQHKWTRFHVLDAVQLFRCVYESEAKPRERWSCDAANREHYADPKDSEPFELRTCGSDKPRCMGHIVKTAKGVGRDLPGSRS
ncbi:hypothetical protein NEMBOFW57_000339 [Staphylotrichum longicolle]|uniref:Uncharacterized protein n=1 Tax=Staphylotrichum longicolle TaxID=669026 RepID=A0AAD4EZF5_9PEZI|nr:hypothetical protein NEMBOFW57_000339 [Staphylotrichum longicolle]